MVGEEKNQVTDGFRPYIMMFFIGCLFDTKHVPKGVDREKSFFNKNILQKELDA